MRAIKLDYLSIRDFKGCPTLDLEFDGQSASIYGANGTGKSTIYDAVSWLLFGRDSLGRTDFDIKPLDNEGNVRDHGTTSCVEARFTAPGEEVTFCRTYFERWSTKRGNSDATYDGNTSEFFVDGVPVKKNEYERRVEEFAPSNLWKVLSNVTWFCGGMDWKDRRKILFELCGTLTDGELLIRDDRFAPLAQEVGKLTLDELKKKLLAERKGLNAERDRVPARLEELRRTETDLANLDFPLLRTQRDEAGRELEERMADRAKLDHGALLVSRRNDLDGAKNRLAALINDNNSHRASQMVPVVDERPQLEAALRRAESETVRWSGNALAERDLIAGLERDIQKYRDRWNMENARVFSAISCPTCGQTLPLNAQEQARVAFLAEVGRNKQEAVDGADRAKEMLEAAKSRREAAIHPPGAPQAGRQRSSDHHLSAVQVGLRLGYRDPVPAPGAPAVCAACPGVYLPVSGRLHRTGGAQMPRHQLCGRERRPRVCLCGGGRADPQYQPQRGADQRRV